MNFKFESIAKQQEGTRLKIGDTFCDVYDANWVTERAISHVSLGGVSTPVPGRKTETFTCNVLFDQLPMKLEDLQKDMVLFFEGYLMKGTMLEFKYIKNDGEKFATITLGIHERVALFSESPDDP